MNQHSSSDQASAEKNNRQDHRNNLSYTRQLPVELCYEIADYLPITCGKNFGSAFRFKLLSGQNHASV